MLSVMLFAKNSKTHARPTARARREHWERYGPFVNLPATKAAEREDRRQKKTCPEECPPSMAGMKRRTWNRSIPIAEELEKKP